MFVLFRRETLVMNMAGSRFTEMFSDQHHTVCCLLAWSVQDITCHLWLPVSSSLPSWETCTPRKSYCKIFLPTFCHLLNWATHSFFQLALYRAHSCWCKHSKVFYIIVLDANLLFFFSIICRRGSILSTTIFVYAATAPVNGFMGGSLYARQGGLYMYIMPVIKKMYWSCHKWKYSAIKLMTQFSEWNVTKSPLYYLWQMHSLGRQWIKQMTLSAVLFPLLVCGTAFMINFIAIYYHASRAIPFATMVSLKT